MADRKAALALQNTAGFPEGMCLTQDGTQPLGGIPSRAWGLHCLTDFCASVLLSACYHTSVDNKDPMG